MPCVGVSSGMRMLVVISTVAMVLAASCGEASKSAAAKSDEASGESAACPTQGELAAVGLYQTARPPDSYWGAAVDNAGVGYSSEAARERAERLRRNGSQMMIGSHRILLVGRDWLRWLDTATGVVGPRMEFEGEIVDQRVVDGRAEITVVAPFGSRHWLVWEPSDQTVEDWMPEGPADCALVDWGAAGDGPDLRIELLVDLGVDGPELGVEALVVSPIVRDDMWNYRGPAPLAVPQPVADATFGGWVEQLIELTPVDGQARTVGIGHLSEGDMVMPAHAQIKVLWGPDDDGLDAAGQVRSSWVHERKPSNAVGWLVGADRLAVEVGWLDLERAMAGLDNTDGRQFVLLAIDGDRVVELDRVEVSRELFVAPLVMVEGRLYELTLEHLRVYQFGSTIELVHDVAVGFD